MSRFFYYLSVGLVLTGTYVLGDEFEKCVELFKPEYIEMKCCESLSQVSGVWNECKTDSYDCKAAACVLQKLGIMKDDTINEDTARSVIDKWGKERPADQAMADRVQQYCLDSQYEDYGVTDDTCDSIKFHVCTYINSVVVCSKWKDTDTCKKVADLAKDCKKSLDEA